MDARRQIVGFTEHAIERMAQRNVTEEDVRYLLMRGVWEHRTGVLCFTLPRRYVPDGDRGERASLSSVVVLVHEGWVITVYRNRRPLHHVRRKLKHYDPRLAGRRAARVAAEATAWSFAVG